MSVIARLLDVLYPPSCAACDGPTDQPLCAVCHELVEPAQPHRVVHAAFAFGGPIADALRQLKFHGRRDVARTLAPLLAEPLGRAGSGCDVIVPVPLARRRLVARGYNQAQLLAHFAGRRIGVPVDAALLRRIRATAPQTGLDRAARRNNVAGAFAVTERGSRRLAGRSILLFDDVATTGATLNAAAEALRQAGCARVVRFAAARAET